MRSNTASAAPRHLTPGNKQNRENACFVEEISDLRIPRVFSLAVLSELSRGRLSPRVCIRATLGLSDDIVRRLRGFN